MRKQTNVFLSAAMMLIAAVSFAGAAETITVVSETPATTQPTTEPGSVAPATRTSASSQPSEAIRRAFEQLADADPDVRDAARIDLMGMKLDQLDALRKIVEENRPLAPSQLAVLHDVVTQVFLANELYDQDPRQSIIGIRPEQFVYTPIAGDDDVAALSQPCVVIAIRFPGFPAYRFLQADDVILGIVSKTFVATETLPDFQEKVHAIPPGDSITLRVIRQGRTMDVSFRVAPVPLHAPANGDEFFNGRSERAEAYWNQIFAPLLSEPIS